MLFNVIIFLVWKGVVGIFGGMGKNVRVCKYPFYRLKSYKYNLSQVTYYTLLFSPKVSFIQYLIPGNNSFNPRFFFNFSSYMSS